MVMMNRVTKQKRAELATFIRMEVLQETSIQGIIVIGSVAKGTARPDSDIDAIVFLEPYDLYAVPAESKWQPDTGEYHGIFSNVRNFIQLDFFKRLDLRQWAQPTYAWPESICAELSEGWIAFDRKGQIQPLITEKTIYQDEIRQARLDESFTKLDWLLNDSTIERTWDNLGARVAHYRLHAAFDYLIQAVFAYNRRWRTLRSRELSHLLKLPWLPKEFDEQLLGLTNALAENQAGYLARAQSLKQCFEEVVAICQKDGLYGDHAVNEAFIRRYDEPGRDWNMDEWNKQHRNRKNATQNSPQNGNQ
jgi:hypothetical protein